MRTPAPDNGPLTGRPSFKAASTLEQGDGATVFPCIKQFLPSGSHQLSGAAEVALPLQQARLQAWGSRKNNYRITRSNVDTGSYFSDSIRIRDSMGYEKCGHGATGP